MSATCRGWLAFSANARTVDPEANSHRPSRALRAEPAPNSHSQPALRDYVAKAVRRYLLDLGDCDSHELYEIVLREIEVPMLTEVMRHCQGNQSRAAATLGLNRATLRKKLREYGIS